MSFNICEINLEQWNHWKKWNTDITLPNAMLGIAFITEFCKTYKKRVDELEKEFQQAKQSIHKTFAEEKSAAEYPSADICKEYSLATVNQMGQNQN